MNNESDMKRGVSSVKRHYNPSILKETMSPEQQRIAISEWCGWTSAKYMDYGSIEVLWYNFKGEQRDLPDYLNDLNAMWEAERKIACENWWGYVVALNRKICEDADEPYNNDSETSFLMINATAVQRAEALLKTIGKWTDDKPLENKTL